MAPVTPKNALRRGGLAQRLIALFLLAALLPLALSDWLSNTAISEIADGLSANDRARTTRQASRQVFDRLLAGKALLLATSSLDPSMERTPDLTRVFRRLVRVNPVSSTAAEPDVMHAWRSVESIAPDRLSKAKSDDSATLNIQMRVVALPVERSASVGVRVMLGVDRGGKLEWVAEFDPDYLWVPVVDAGGNGEWSVADADNRALLHIRGNDERLDRASEDADVVKASFRLFLGAEFDSGDWIFTQRSARSQVLWEGQRLSVWLALTAVATLLAVAFLGKWQIRRTLAPLELLTEGTRLLAAGAIDTRVAIESDDEIGTLAVAFNEMSARIEGQFASMRGLSAIDRDILNGVPFGRLAESVLLQLTGSYPGAFVTVCWLDPQHSLCRSVVKDSGAAGRNVSTEIIELSAQQAIDFSNVLSHADNAAAAEPALATMVNPWSHEVANATDRVFLMPLRTQGQTYALITLVMPQVLAERELEPAHELRDRLAVALAAQAREQELLHRAVHDSLTGLTNRYGLNADLDAMLARGAPGRIAVLFLDLDHFKDVNDSRGHDAGDELLQHASRRLLENVPPRALVARQGGDEFAIIVAVAEDAHACEIASSAIDALSRPFALGSGEYLLGASVGIALYPEHGRSREELLRCADVALYAAKSAGRGRYVQFNATLDAVATERIQLLSELRGAVERSEFVAHYQPRVRPEDGAVNSAEALVRWMHPTRGLLFPDSFIGLAESSGLIDAIGLWMLRAACAQMADWRAQGVHIERMSVNVSPRQLASGKLVKQVRETLDSFSLPPDSLELEVTESLMIDNAGGAWEQLNVLRSWGVSIALDDFGTGYSSMSTLRKLPIDVMKIDRSFVKDLGIDDGALAMIRTIVTLAKSLRLHLVAEGVETQAQSALLQSMGCDELQGYLFSRPIPAVAFAKLPGVVRLSPDHLECHESLATQMHGAT